jgi:3-methyladenine DNA glycosylase AlkD
MKKIVAALHACADKPKAAGLQRFFKTGPGEYAEGDRFIGVTVPQIRRVAREFQRVADDEVIELLRSPIHEERLLALLIWTLQMPKASPARREAVAAHYERHFQYINNWDLVDLSAPVILGATFTQETLLPKLRVWALSDHLWTRRIAVLSTFAYTRSGDPGPAFEISNRLLRDPHDLIHKAVGWMLREAGKRCGQAGLEAFLMPRYGAMSRTMLRYAIERFPEPRRQLYLKGLV